MHACKWKNYVETTSESIMIRSLFQIPPRSWKIALPVSHCGNYPLSCSFCLFLGADRMLILELAARSSQWKAQVSGICPSRHTALVSFSTSNICMVTFCRDPVNTSVKVEECLTFKNANSLTCEKWSLGNFCFYNERCLLTFIGRHRKLWKTMKYQSFLLITTWRRSYWKQLQKLCLKIKA